MLHVALDLRVVGLAANKTLGVEDGVLRVGVERVLRTITNTRETWVGTPLQEGEGKNLQSFIVREADP